MPFGKRTSTVVFEGIAAIEVTVEVEMVADGGLDRGELLQGLDVSKPRHRPFPSSKRLVHLIAGGAGARPDRPKSKR